MTPQQQALSIIRGEHRTLAAVINALEHVAADMAVGKLTPDYKLLWSILYYIEQFPDRLHHPKKDTVLFPRIRARTGDIDDTPDELRRQHVYGYRHLNHLKSLPACMEADIPGALAEFSGKVATCASFH